MDRKEPVMLRKLVIVFSAAAALPVLPAAAAALDASTVNSVYADLNTAINADWSSPSSIFGNIMGLLGMGGGGSKNVPPAVQQETVKVLLEEIPSAYPVSLTPTGSLAAAGVDTYSNRLVKRAGYGGDMKAAGKAFFDPKVLADMQGDYMERPMEYNRKMYESSVRWLNTQQSTLDAIMAGQAKVLESMQKHQKFVDALLKSSNDETSLMAVMQYKNMLLMTVSAQLSDLTTLLVWNTKLGILDKQSELVNSVSSINDDIVRASKIPSFVDNPNASGAYRTSSGAVSTKIKR